MSKPTPPGVSRGLANQKPRLGTNVYLAPGRVAAIPALGIAEARMYAYSVRWLDQPDAKPWRTAATTPVHAAYRFLWAHPEQFQGLRELRVEHVTAAGAGDTWRIDVEIHPVVLSTVRFPREGADE